MQNKIQELTEKLYNEGLSKGREEGEKMLEEARIKAEGIISSAKAEAVEITAKAAKDAEDLKGKAASDIKAASAHALQATKADIEKLVIARISSAKVDAALADKDFVKEIISTVAEKFSTTEGTDLSLVLPASMQAELEPWVASQLGKTLSTEVKAEFSKKIAGGFTIGPKDGSWFIDLSDEAFRNLIAEYLRPVTKKLLFGE